MTISKLQYRWHMDKRAVEAAIEEWSNEQLAALLVSISRLLQQRLESRDPSPQSEWSTVTSVAPGGKGYSGHSTAAGSSETAHPPIQTAPPPKGKRKRAPDAFSVQFLLLALWLGMHEEQMGPYESPVLSAQEDVISESRSFIYTASSFDCMAS